MVFPGVLQYVIIHGIERPNIFEHNKEGARLSHILRRDAGVLWAGKTICRLDLLIPMLNRG
jgi:hypothetical protein